MNLVTEHTQALLTQVRPYSMIFLYFAAFFLVNCIIQFGIAIIHRSRFSFYMGLVLLGSVFGYSYTGFLYQGYIFEYPFLYKVHWISTFFEMVFVYYALHYLLQKDVAPGRIINICLQGICFSALIVTFFLPDSNSEVFQSIITRSIELEYPWYYPDLAGNILMQTATLVGFLIMAYEIILQFNWKIIWKDRQKKGIIRDIGALFLFILTFHALLWALVFIASSHEKYSHWLGILNILEVGSYFLSLLFLQISPFFIQVRLKAHGMEKKKSYQYLTSRLNDNDVDMLEKKLAALNEFEKIFLDENLTLVRLAQLTGVSAKQLSEYLNRYQEMNFQSYLQHLRLDFAKKMITENPDMSIAKICYLSGFNSLASFYRNFRKHTGQTPLDFQAESTEQPK